MLSPNKRKKLHSQERNLTDLPKLRTQPAWKKEGGNTFTCLKKPPPEHLVKAVNVYSHIPGYLWLDKNF